MTPSHILLLLIFILCLPSHGHCPQMITTTPSEDQTTNSPICAISLTPTD